MQKKPYNIDQWSERDLGWKPCGHAETIQEGRVMAINMSERVPTGKFRVREKDTHKILFVRPAN